LTSEETIGILSILKTAYPQFYKDMKKSEADSTINLWATMFSADEAYIVTEAVKSLITSLKFPPTIADVKEKIYSLTHEPVMTEQEAWQTVKDAISYYNPGFDSLPPILQKLVGSPNQLREWAIMESNQVETVVKSNFIRSYTARVKQEKEYAMLPESGKELQKQLSNWSSKLFLME
jgi:hypothetical protein